MNSEKLNNLRIVHINARSIRKNMTEVEAFLKIKKRIDIVMIGETWLYSEEEQFFNITGFTASFVSQNASRGGGSAIYIRQDIKHRVIEVNSSFNTIVIRLEDTKPGINIAVCYKSPNDNSHAFIEHVDYLFDKYKKLIVIGDTNIDLLSESYIRNQYMDMLELNSVELKNTINRNSATRVTNNSATIIDHVLSDLKTNQFGFNITLYGIPNLDHKAVCVEIKSVLRKLEKLENKKILITNYGKYSQMLENYFRHHDCENIEELVDLINNTKNRCTTERTIRTRSNNHWMSNEIIRLMRCRNKLYRKHKKYSECLEYKNDYVKVKNKVNCEIRKAKQSFFNKNLLAAGTNIRKIWNVLNSHITKKKIGGSNVIKEIIYDDKLINNSKEIANKFNDYFSSIGMQLAEKIQTGEANEVTNIVNEKTMFLVPTDVKEVFNIIMELKESAPGYDNVTAKDLKVAANILAPKICYFINNCFNTGVYPDSLKCSSVIPIFKSGSQLDISNYRPISLTSCLSKIFEKLINTRICEFIKNSCGFDPSQYGFQKSHGTDVAINESIRTITNSLDKGNYVCTVFVDLRKAFDTVNHEILLDRIQELGIRGLPHVLIKSYLEKRVIKTKVNGVFSEQRPITLGVPQGSVLGPTLYLLYVNNMQFAGLKAEYKIFADDTLLIYEDKNEKELESIVNSDLVKYMKWVNGNKLSVNIEKTKYMICKLKGKPDINPKICIGNTELAREMSYKYLGVIIDYKLSWYEHICSILKRIRPLLGAIKRCGIKLNKKSARLIFHAHIMSHIRYNVATWSCCSNVLKNKVNLVMNKAIKIMFGLNWRTPTEELYKKTGFLKLNEVIVLEKAKTIHKIENGVTKSKNSLKKRKNVHNYNTRNLEKFCHVKTRTELARNSSFNSSLRIYNSLPQQLKKVNDIGTFSKRLKVLLKKDSKLSNKLLNI